MLSSIKFKNAGRAFRQPRPESQGSQMPKLKSKSGAKKRFKITATGKVKCNAAGKRHGMIKRTNKFIRNARGMMVLSDEDAKVVKKHYLPYAR
jgi:large subunit ribosomal protein L35